ncbi:hypothetical protein ACFQX6_31100 [Streptosporangium lutulentum]
MIHRMDSDIVAYRDHVEAHMRWHHLADYLVVMGTLRFTAMAGTPPTPPRSRSPSPRTRPPPSSRRTPTTGTTGSTSSSPGTATSATPPARSSTASTWARPSPCPRRCSGPSEGPTCP